MHNTSSHIMNSFSFSGCTYSIEVPRLEAETELPLPTTATPDLHLRHLHHSLCQCQILNPLSEARDRTCILVDTSQVLNLLSHHGSSPESAPPPMHFFFFKRGRKTWKCSSLEKESACSSTGPFEMWYPLLLWRSIHCPKCVHHYR